MSRGFTRRPRVPADELDDPRWIPQILKCSPSLTLAFCTAKVEEAFRVPENKGFDKFDHVFDLTGETRYDRPEIVRRSMPLFDIHLR